jgi:carbon-monoxide dehydrogenase small subunit
MCGYLSVYNTTCLCERHTCTNGGITVEIQLTINDEPATVEVGPDDDLATVLRRNGYTGVKCGCDGGVCGASKVFLDDEVAMACGVDARNADGSDVETIENLGSQDDLHPIQEAFVDHFAVQCGFCIPGMILQAKSLLADNPDPSEAEVREAIDDNLCRCTGYQKPVEAILDAADRMRGERSVAADGGSQITSTAVDCTDPNGDTDE